MREGKTSGAMSLCCPLCSASVAASGLEAHLRFEVALPLHRCAFCPQSFVDDAAAENHFAGPFAKHPGSQPQLITQPSDPAKTARLLELLRLARGGPEAIQQRLCVCGHCRLLCREDFRPTSSPPQSLESYQPAPGHSLSEPGQLEPHWTPSQDSEAPSAKQSPWQPKLVDEEPSRPEAQPVAEAYEEEAQAPLDVKPSLAELKPQLVTDGKVACLQCAMRLDKNHFSDHVRKHHVPGNPFQCLLCPVNTKAKGELAKHQRTEHGTELGPETFTGSLAKEVVKEWIGLCFGEARGVGYGSLRCRPCDKAVIAQDIKKHIGKVHLKKVLHACRTCAYASTSPALRELKVHVEKAHGQTAGPETIDSSGLHQYAPIIKAMVQQLCEKSSAS